MESYKRQTTIAGYLAISGAISMFVGAAFWTASGTDLWATLANREMDVYLNQLCNVKHFLVLNSSFWILGVLLMGSAGRLMANFCTNRQALAMVASTCMNAAVPTAIVSFITMLSLAINPPSSDVAFTVGWVGARLDDLATMLIIGVFPVIISIAGRLDWVPKWLLIYGVTAGVTGLLSIMSLYTGIVHLGFIIVPVGLGWMIAAGIVLIRKNSLHQTR